MTTMAGERAPIGAALPPWPEPDFSEFGETEAKPLGRIQALTAAFMHRNWLAIPHVTHHDQLDVTALETHRKALAAQGPEHKLGPLVFQVKAVVGALRRFPRFNASLDAAAKNLVLKKYFHIGIAVDTPNGLLVGVIRDCDRKSVTELSGEIAQLAAKARSKGLGMGEMSGGCFTLSSLGGIGGTGFTPIINAPEVAILGICPVQSVPRRGAGDTIEWRQVLPVSLSYDHRVINGADAARFTRCLEELLADPVALTA